MNENEMKFEFLCRSIADKQSAIRGIDVKCGFLFVIVFSPVAKLGKIYEVYQHVTNLSCLYYTLVLFVLFLWLISLWSLFACVSALNDPGKHVSGKKPEGVFYNASLYFFGIKDCFFNFSSKSNVRIDEYFDKLPKTTDGLLEELFFENVKLAYIRDLKSFRLTFCIRAVIGWVLVGVGLWGIFLGTGGGSV